MLDKCGMKSLDDLYADVPAELRLKKEGYDLPEEMTEDEVRAYFEGLASLNQQPAVSLLGAGFYNHYCPAVIPNLLTRSEFLTAYTPYQPEISQGTLQYIFEYQTMMTQLTGLDASNASMYDGTTAVAEAMMMSVAASRKRNRVIVSATLNPIYREVVDTYAHYHGVKIDTIPEKDGVTDLAAMEQMLQAGDVAGAVIATPNYYGILENLEGVADKVHAAKALLIITAPASALGVIKTPKEWGADIAAGEAQSLGMPLSFGGPYLGYLCCTNALIRKMPGRIVGATKDADGKRVFVLTLQAREQHIRRDKATSNICSNQGLMTLYAAMYLSLMGAKGLKQVNEISCDGAHYLAKELEKTSLLKLKYPDKPFLNEFVAVAESKEAMDELLDRCEFEEVVPGYRISDTELLICVTERNPKEDLDFVVEVLSGDNDDDKDA